MCLKQFQTFINGHSGAHTPHRKIVTAKIRPVPSIFLSGSIYTVNGNLLILIEFAVLFLKHCFYLFFENVMDEHYVPETSFCSSW